MTKKGKRPKLFEIRYMSLLIALAVFVLIALLSVGTKFPLFNAIELGMLDQNFNLKVTSAAVSEEEGVSYATTREAKVSQDIAIIGVDQTALDQLGRWPWRRSVQARLMESTARLRTPVNRERALLVDFFYNEPTVAKEDDALRDAMAENGRVFLETIPQSAWYDARVDEATTARRESDQEVLYRKHGTVVKVSGAWWNVRPYFSQVPPLEQFGKNTEGYGHAILEHDSDQTFRRVALVARCSRLITEKDIPVKTDDLGAALKTFSVNRENFEWLAWKDKTEKFRRIDETTLGDPAAMARLGRLLSDEALRNKGEAYSIRLFGDYFVPAISLSLALEYYHKKISDVEIKYGEYVRIPDPEIYVIDDDDMLNPSGGWQSLMRDGKIVKEIRIPVDAEGAMLINFMGPSSDVSKTYWVSSYWQFANPAVIPKEDAPPARRPISRGYANKIVIACAYTTGMAEDEKSTPLGLMYGGEVHANAVNTIIMDNFLTQPPVWLTLAIVLAAVLLTAFVSSRLPSLLSLFMTVWFVAVYFIAVNFLFDFNNIILNFSEPAIGIFFTFLFIVAYRIIFEEQDKRRIKGMFAKYVNAQVVEQILLNPPELGGVDKEITVLFSDIRGFTTLSETLTPQALVNHLNVYLTEMTDVIFKYYGTLDKYVGDEIMCFWGAPLPQKEHAILACQCALRQIEVLNELNRNWPPEKRINIGIGINSGIMTVGNMGSPGRMNYTLMGDNCNLGARLEGTNKSYGTTIILSEYTYGLVKDRVVVRELDNIRVKGKNKPVLIYELLDVKDGLEPPKPAAV
ncbi:MAG: adenylate/guanylate cyclase domain-containing protein [Spirochaetales bacterium]|nr:adenylate/guanylate cyclase domain-containing protein [Spirochaetales bacterium]